MYQKMRAAWALSTIGLMAACGGGESGATGEWAGSVTDSAGIAIVTNPSDGLWGGPTPWTISEEVRIGGLDAPLESQFGLVVSIDVDADGRMYVADQQAQDVRVFAADGTYERTIGSPGDGPGELGLGVAGVFVDDSGVHVPDMANFRLSSFAFDGEFTGSTALDLTRGIPIRWDQHPDGRVVAQLRSAGQGIGEGLDGDEVRAIGEDEAILRLPRGESFEISEGGLPQFSLFEPEPVWDLGETGNFVTGVNSEYRLRVLDSSGNPVRIISKPTERRPVTETQQRVILDAFGELLVDQGVPPAALDQFLAGVSFAEFYPTYAQIVVAADGAIWVQLLKTAEDIADDEEFNLQDFGSDDWDVFDPEGRYLGQLTMPTKFQPIAFRGDVLYGVQRDELDVQSVVRLRIDRN